MSDLQEVKRGLDQEIGKGFLVGGEYYSPSLRVHGRYFHFRPDQMRFLLALTKTRGDVQAASKAAHWTDERTTKFFSGQKWRQYKEQVLASASVRNGDLRDEWWSFMLNGMKGKVEYYEGTCGLCHQPYKIAPAIAEQYRNDDMKLDMECGLCRSPVALEYREEEFKPSREQVQCASEIGSRVEPKTERISHSFTEETFSFE